VAVALNQWETTKIVVTVETRRLAADAHLARLLRGAIPICHLGSSIVMPRIRKKIGSIVVYVLATRKRLKNACDETIQSHHDEKLMFSNRKIGLLSQQQQAINNKTKLKNTRGGLS